MSGKAHLGPAYAATYLAIPKKDEERGRNVIIEM